jgi:hypothetical protein
MFTPISLVLSHFPSVRQLGTRSQRDRQDALHQRLRELAAVRRRFGYRRLTVLLIRESWRVNEAQSPSRGSNVAPT